jgi:hypothetical protein
MKNTIGRPRKLTDRHVKIILGWDARYVIWRALGKTLKSQRTLSRELGVSQATIIYVAPDAVQCRCDQDRAQRFPANRARSAQVPLSGMPASSLSGETQVRYSAPLGAQAGNEESLARSRDCGS